MSAAPGIGLLLLRIATGVILIAHGYQKFVVDGIAATTGYFASLAIPFPELTAPAVAGFEIIGGLLLVVGIGTRIVGGLLAIEMLVAILLQHLAGGFFVADGGFEFAMLLGVIGLAFALGGAGGISADGLIGRRRRSRR